MKHTLFSTNRGEKERERVHVIFDYGNFQLTAAVSEMHQWQRLPTKHQTEGSWFWVTHSRKEHKKINSPIFIFLTIVVTKFLL